MESYPLIVKLNLLLHKHTGRRRGAEIQTQSAVWWWNGHTKISRICVLGAGWCDHGDCCHKLACSYFFEQRWRRRQCTYVNLVYVVPRTTSMGSHLFVCLLALNEPICLLWAMEQLPIFHLFIQSTARFALSNICVWSWEKRSEEQLDICLMFCFLLKISEQSSVCSELANRPIGCISCPTHLMYHLEQNT